MSILHLVNLIIGYKKRDAALFKTSKANPTFSELSK